MGSRPWTLAAATLLGIAAVLLVLFFALRSSGALLVGAAALAALSVLGFLAGRLMSPRRAPAPMYSDRPSDPPFQSAATMELERLRDRLAETEGRPLKRIPQTDLSGTAREVAEALNARLDALSGTEKEQQQFIADVSHELRTPLTVLRGTLEVALEEDRPAEEYREAIGNALLETRHLARISQNILFLARGESGRVTLSFPNQDRGRFLPEVTRELQPAAASARSVGEVRGAGHPLPGPPPDEQVLHNVLENSMRYSTPGGTVRVRLSRTPDEARIEVIDSGVGIPERDLPFVFERFFRSDRARRAYSGGSGLGLSIVRWIVEAHKGKVEIESRVDQGTTVRVRLPLVT